ncbi:MAG: DNA replication and repair protein RecF [Anaerolineae bacterium]|nr:DNA replication and repair protein RecF [Anaerolineae bacterium]MCX8067259.1 DNA replication and repair protein RecF [Anaerolineae bacterium]MDW7992278.1 DNA replication and repair protein RecF [Anaerolineae bacterium]
MYIRSLSLENFRNYVRLEISWPQGPILLVGGNAQGKTSLLEALHVLATGRSPLTAVDRQMINWAAEGQGLAYAHLRAEVVRRREVREIAVTMALTRAVNGTPRFQKSVRIDRQPRRLRDLANGLNVVLFLPQDVDLVGGDPAGRRDYLDTTLSQVDGAYAAALETYTETLRQRNALLRHLAEEGGDPAQLDPLDERLARSGVAVAQGRRRLVAALSRYVGPLHARLTGEREWLRLEYRPNFDPASPPALAYQMNLRLEEPEGPPPGISNEDLVHAFLQRLRQRRREEIERGMTLTGPHRDELRFLVGSVDLGVFGSRGQQRTAVLALKLAQLAWMREVTGESPVLLLDEVLAELDEERRALLLARVEEVEQAVLTATDPEMFSRQFRERAAIFRVFHGILQSDG